ncbi:Gustatory receptor for sugar taste 64d [Folsomia candida]|uniref:Gustatory receptor for sugar taste 64d n=1 Tax=Folsomia candida TaxID=158441 RepID=A0A226F3I7_FOLCA|nr:Gustatory receptor for sugar taste 64d [Folsomia candida]
MVNSATKIQKCHDEQSLQEKLRYYLIFGRVIGILPIQGVFHRGSKLTFKKFSLASFTTLIITLLIGAYAIINLIASFSKKQTNALEIAWAVLPPALYTLGTFNCIIFWIHGSKFCNLFATWNNLSRLHFPVEDTTLSRDVGIWAIVIFTSAISETISWPLIRDNRLRFPDRFSNLGHFTSDTEYYYAIRLELCGRSDRDICSGAVRTIQRIEGSLRIRDERYFGEDTAFWEFLVDDHGRIYQVMQSFKEFLSPIIFATCAANMFWICLVVLFILVPFLQAKDIFKFYAIWNFLHVVVRFFTMSLLAAKVSSDAHKFADILKQCPIEMYTPKTGLLCIMISRVDIRSDLAHRRSEALDIVTVNPVTDNQTCHDKPSLQEKLRYYLIFGRIIGILPIQGVFHRGSKLTFKKCSLASCITLIIALLIGTYAIFNLIQSFSKKQTNAFEIAWAALLPALYTLGTFNCMIFWINGSRFYNLFSTWKNLSRLHFPVEDTTLSRDVGIWAVIIFTSAISESTSWPFLRHDVNFIW